MIRLRPAKGDGAEIARLRARVAELEEEVATLTSERDAAIWKAKDMQREINAALGHLVNFVEREGEDVPVIDVRSSAPVIEGRAAPARDEEQAAYAPEPPTKAATKPAKNIPQNIPGAKIGGPQQRILDALAWWEGVGVPAPKRVQIAVVAGYSPEGGAFMNPLGTLRTSGLIEYPAPGTARLTPAGRKQAARPARSATNADLHAKIMAILDGPRRRILEPLLRAYPRALTREQLAAAAEYEPKGGAFMNPLGALRSLGLVEYPEPGKVAALPVLFIDEKPRLVRG
jgi:hypothetical protein